MVGHLRVKSPWSQLGIFLGLFGAAFFTASIVMAVIVLSKGLPVSEMQSSDWSDPRIVSTMKTVQAISSIIIFLVPALVWALICFNSRPMYFLGLKEPVSRQTYLFAIICILAAFPFVMWLGELNQLIPLPKWMTEFEEDATKQMKAFLKAESPVDIVINVIIIAVLPAFCEEICFRGALQRIIIQICRSPWVGIVVTSVFFSALHLQFQGFLPRMFLGVILGAIFWYSGSLWPSIVAHFVNNAVQVVAVSYAPEYIEKNPSVPVLAALISGFIVALTLWRFKTLSNVSFEKVYEPEKLHPHNQYIA
jgi:membrane protease YdiL (CAAX protease family)